jgi:fluoride exporter
MFRLPESNNQDAPRVRVSSFSLQTLNLMSDGERFRAGGNIGLSVALCLIAVWGGYMLASTINAMKWI